MQVLNCSKLELEQLNLFQQNLNILNLSNQLYYFYLDLEYKCVKMKFVEPNF